MGLTFGSFTLLLVASAPMVFVLGVAAALTLVVATEVPMVGWSLSGSTTGSTASR